MQQSTVNQLVWQAIHTGVNAEPWRYTTLYAFGGTGSASNPNPVLVGSVGEVTSFPYEIPQHHILVLQQLHLNSLQSNLRECDILLLATGPGFTGRTLWELGKYNEHADCDFSNGLWLPAGLSLGVTLFNLSGLALTLYLMLEGILVDVSSASKGPQLYTPPKGA